MKIIACNLCMAMMMRLMSMSDAAWSCASPN